MSESVRLRASSRAAGSLVGAVVTALGLTCIAVYSGRRIDLELLGIAILGAAGAWLLLSAIAAGLSNTRRNSRTAAQIKADMMDDAGELRASAWLAAKEATEAKRD